MCALKPRQSDVIECRQSTEAEGVQSVMRTDPLPASFANDLFAAGSARNITRLVRASPEQYAGRMWSIPLISPLIDAARGRELALSIMCGREIACTVELSISYVAPFVQ